MNEAFLFVFGGIVSTAVVGTVWRIGQLEVKALREMRGQPEPRRESPSRPRSPAGA